ncbi:hypothetical protein EP073_11540 [Geovibrio thiophilus]|uniref:Alginate export domain-containing protein n=1 Tax=Geovibrio thiophilus TaxID=139438 RepID=A0A3R5V2J8_9BACT|nr:hypothetical protein [Geovibrio thiophilus]QAR34014.1 hypothetical protein EP073_11540 [Geovibrio thiophilus]
MRYLSVTCMLFCFLLSVTAMKAEAFENGASNTPDSRTQQVSPGQFKESYEGIGLTEDTKIYLTLTSRYRLRTNDYADDQDFYQYLRVHTDAVKLGDGTVRFAAFARFADDIDGDHKKSWGDNYYYYHRDALDTQLGYDDWAPRLYNGYAQFDGVIKNTVLNVGRFYLSHQNTFQLDGADASVKLGEMVEVYAFGGKPVSYYYDVDDDTLFGGGINVKVMEQTKIGAEYVRLDVTDIDDDYTKFRLDQAIPNGNLVLAYTLLNDAATVNAEGTYEIVSTGTILTLKYEGLTDEVDYENSYVVNPLTNTLLAESKYSKYEAGVYQAFLKNFAAGLTYETKAVSGTENFDNRDYSRIKGKFDIYGLPSENTYVSFSVDYWDVKNTPDSDDNERLQYGVQVSQKVGRTMDVWAGTSFSRYEYDYINDRRKDSVRSYYIGGQYQPTKILSLMADLSMEDTEFYDDVDTSLDKNYTAELWANIIF